MTNEERKGRKTKKYTISKEELDKRIETYKILIDTQAKLEALRRKTIEAITNRYNKPPEILDEYGAFPFVVELDHAEIKAEDNSKMINEMIESGKSLEDIAKFIQEGYEDENGIHHDVDFINVSSIYFKDLQDKRVDLKEDIVGYNPQYLYDDSVAYYHIAQDVAKKGIPIEELPAELLFDRRFISDFIESKVTTKDINKMYKSGLIDYVEDLKRREKTVDTTEASQAPKKAVSVADIAKAIQNRGEAEKADDELGDDEGNR